MTVFSDNAEWSSAAATVAAKPVWRGGGGRGGAGPGNNKVADWYHIVMF